MISLLHEWSCLRVVIQWYSHWQIRLRLFVVRIQEKIDYSSIRDFLLNYQGEMQQSLYLTRLESMLIFPFHQMQKIDWCRAILKSAWGTQTDWYGTVSKVIHRIQIDRARSTSRIVWRTWECWTSPPLVESLQCVDMQMVSWAHKLMVQWALLWSLHFSLKLQLPTPTV